MHNLLWGLREMTEDSRVFYLFQTAACDNPYTGCTEYWVFKVTFKDEGSPTYSSVSGPYEILEAAEKEAEFYKEAF